MRILLVDDDRSMKTSTAFRLQKYGKVDMAETFAEAAAIVTEQAHDIIVADQMIPGGTGIQVIEIATRKNPFCGCILISGMLSVEMCCEANEKGAALLLEKPFTMDKLEEYVATLIKRRDAVRQFLRDQMLKVAMTAGKIDLSAASIALSAYKPTIDD